MIGHNQPNSAAHFYRVCHAGIVEENELLSGKGDFNGGFLDSQRIMERNLIERQIPFLYVRVNYDFGHTGSANLG